MSYFSSLGKALQNLPSYLPECIEDKCFML